MANSSEVEPRATSYSEFVALVRRHSPLELLPELARVGAHHYRTGAMSVDPGTSLYPWVVSAAARESIAWGNQYRSTPVTDRALIRIGQSYANLRDPFLNEHDEPGSIHSFFTRTAFEQFPYQQLVYNEVGRVYALLNRDYSELSCEVLSRDAWKNLLGADFSDFLGAASLLSASALVNKGFFDPGWLMQPNFRELVLVLSDDVIMEVFEKVFAADYNAVRDRIRAVPQNSEDLRRLEFNPLRVTPYVRMPDNRYLAPQPHFVTQRTSVESLYYLAWQEWKYRFTRDLGRVVETYVGEQLDLLAPAVTRHGEIEYESGQLSVDHIIMLSDHAILVEVKAARVAQPGRLDINGYLEDARKDVGKAFRQIERTAHLIRSGHPSFSGIPRDMRLRGLVVTAEPHHLLNSGFFRRQLGQSTMPISILSLSELETFLGIASSGDPRVALLDVTNFDETHGIDVQKEISRLSDQSPMQNQENPILARAWESLPWRDALER